MNSFGQLLLIICVLLYVITGREDATLIGLSIVAIFLSNSVSSVRYAIREVRMTIPTLDLRVARQRGLA